MRASVQNRFVNILLLFFKKYCTVYVANVKNVTFKKTLHFDTVMEKMFSETITKVLKLPQKVNIFKVVFWVIQFL